MSQTKEQIKANISRNITTNGVGEITGEVMRRVLNNMTDNLGLEKDISDLQSSIEDLSENKVDKVPGKGLSTEDYTSEEKQKLAGIEAGAQKNVNADWDASSGDAQILNKPDLSVYATKASVEDIEALIPSQASESNQLADKEFVNSSISTNTAEFKGTYNSLAELEAVSANENDYGFVISTDASGNTVYNRYKYTGGAWLFEYALNNSSFTAAQWDAIQSGITPSLVTKLSALPTATELNNSLNNKVDKVTGKGLSTNDYTTADKNKLAGIAEGAQVNVLEGVKVDGTELPITDKKVDIDLSGKVNVAEHQSQEDQSFVFRQTGGGDLTIDAKNAELTSIKGKTLAWNQLFDGDSQKLTLRGVECTITNGRVVGTGVANSTSQIAILLYNGEPLVPGHKYFVYFAGTIANASIRFYYGSYTDPLTAPRIVTSTTDSNVDFAFFPHDTTSTVSIDVHLFLIDLTLMYGAGNEPSTVEEFEAMFPEAYYPYNAGTPISNDASVLETVGFNQWDEEWEVGSLDQSGNNYSSTTRMRGKNYIPCVPGAEYYIKATEYCDIHFYDANKAHIDGYLQKNNQTFTAPANAAFMRFCGAVAYGATYLYDICINLSDASKNGTYEPYWKRIINLNLSTLKDKDGNLVFPNGGMNGVGAAFDMLKPDADGVIRVGTRAFGRVDLGTLSITRGTASSYYSCISGRAVNSNNLLCAKYPTITPRNSFTENGICNRIGSDGVYFNIFDSRDLSAEDLKSDLSGVMLYYELATPVEFELAEPIPNSILVDELGTEQAIFPTHEDGTPSAPFCADISYSEAHVKYNEIEGMPDIINNLSDVMTSDASKVGSNGTVTTIISLTQAQYDALTTKDPNTVYIIKNS